MKLPIVVLIFLYTAGGASSQNVTTLASDVNMTTVEAGTAEAGTAEHTTTPAEITTFQADAANETTTSTTSPPSTISLSEPSTMSTKPITSAESTTSDSCGPPPNNVTSSCVTSGCTGNATGRDASAPGRVCTDIYTCGSGTWKISASCVSYYCDVPGIWGKNCTKVCGGGCPGNATKFCDMETGKCKDPSSGEIVSGCEEGYRGERCQDPICPLGCGSGECLYPNFCGNCPKHFSSGPTCRNIRLDGFLKGFLPSLAILSVILIALTVASKWYIRRKIKEN